MGKEPFEGKEIVFHTPSEHMIKYRFDMEIQAVYESTGDNLQSNERAILSFLFRIEPGKHNDFLENLDLTRIPNVVMTNPPFLSNSVDSI